MDINVYLKRAFQVYPTMYRDLALFLSKDSVRASVVEPEVPDTCGCCGGEITAHQTASKKRGTLFTLSCSQCGMNSGEGQTTMAKAVWSLHRKRGSWYNEVPPVLQHNTNQVLNKRAYQATPEAIAVKWLSAVNFVDKAWKLQTKTGDFKLMSRDEQEYISTLTLVIGVVKRQAVDWLESLGLDASNENVREMLNGEMNAIIAERRQHYPRYRASLTKTMEFKVAELLN